MFTKQDIEKTLIEFNYFIDTVTLANFIKNWKIDPIYEDEDGVEFYDNLAIVKLKKGIGLKSQGYTNEQIIYHISKILPEKAENEQNKKEQEEQKEENSEKEVIKNEIQNEFRNEIQKISEIQIPQSLSSAAAVLTGNELKNVTVDVTSQTLQMLAETIAEKITNQISQNIILPENTLREDNKLLAEKVEELTSDNRVLAKRVQELEQARTKHFFNFAYFTKFFK